MRSVVRVLAAAALAAIGLSCADQSVSGLRARLALLSINPAFSTAPDGGPDIDIRKIRGVLRNSSGTDSAVAEAQVQGDSAILEFLRVAVTGDSTPYSLAVQAFDQSDALVFAGNQTIQVKPGENPPAVPQLAYVATDTAARTLDIRTGTPPASATIVNLRWQGALGPGNTQCLIRATPAENNPVTQVQLNVVGRTQSGSDVANVRVGWTSLDTTVATVDDKGLVKSRCSKKTTSVIARTFTDRADTITIDVFAPAFTLRMNPETATLPRGTTRQFAAREIDERGNESTAKAIWSSSDSTKATVDSNGVVTAVRNGRVQITATSGSRTTVGIVDVVRPAAASVKVIPQKDTIAVSTVRQFVAVAFDALGKVIGDAAEFTWSSSDVAIAAVDSKGQVTAKTQANTTAIVTATIDGKSGTSELRVLSSLPPGTLKGVVRDGVTDAPVNLATISTQSGATTQTNSAGQFQLLNSVQQGDTITLSASGYITIKFYDAPAFPNQTIFVDDIPLPPNSTGMGTISGKVINALNTQGVSGITVTAYSGLNSAPSPRRPNPTAVATRTTQSGANAGRYSFELPPGAYTFVAGGAGYSQSVGVGIVVGGASRSTGDIILPPAAANAGVYAVLTWRGPGTNVPADLDLHITGPASSTSETSPFQVYGGGGNRSFVVSTDTVASIDVPDNTGPGAEVGSVRPGGIPGIYRFYVKNVGGLSGSRALADSSDARVDVFQDNRVIATFLPPTGVAGTVWEVFRFDGARVVPVGAITSPADPNVLPNK